MELGEMVSLYRQQAGMTIDELVEKSGVPKGTITKIIGGVTKAPTLENIKAIARALGKRLEDFEDDPKTENLFSPVEQNIIKKYRSLDPYGKETIDIALERETARIKYIRELESRPVSTIEFGGKSDTPSRILQYFHSVSAGTGQVLFDDTYSERITIPDIPEYRRVVYAVKVNGHSMEPLYNDGDMLLIEPTCTIDIGEIGIFNVDGQAFVKRLGEGELISLNAGYKNIALTSEARCMGRVVDKFTDSPLK